MSASGVVNRELLNTGLSLGIAGVGLVSILGWLGTAGWLLDVASHFRLQYGVLLSLGAVLAWWLGNPTLALIAALLAFSNLVFLFPLYSRLRPVRAATPQTRSYRVLFANVWQPNQEYASLRRLVEQTAPDLVLLVESNQRWLDELEALRPAYPFWAVQPREDNYGVAVFSRWPVLHSEVRAFSVAEVPSVIARLDLDGQPLSVVCTHPPPPKSSPETRARNEQIENLATLAAERQTPMLLCGDLNLTPWSPVFWRFLRRSGLVDSARGFGVQPSWPVGKPWMSVPLDHCLVSPEIVILDRRLGPAIGSDHYPVWVDFTLPAS